MWATDHFQSVIWEYPSTSRKNSGFSRDLFISREKTEEMRNENDCEDKHF